MVLLSERGPASCRTGASDSTRGAGTCSALPPPAGGEEEESRPAKGNNDGDLAPDSSPHDHIRPHCRLLRTSCKTSIGRATFRARSVTPRRADRLSLL